MKPDPLTMSLETVIAGSTMLGHRLEDRSRVRDGQDPELSRAFRDASTVPFADAEQQQLFLVAPLDVLVAQDGDHKQFHITETNGTGIGGLTNLPLDIVATVLDGLSEFAASLSTPDALVLAAVSGKESGKNPRHNHLVHEKLLYAEAIKRGFEATGRPAQVLTMPQLEQDPDMIRGERPTVVLGYIKDLLNTLSLRRDGRLTLFGRPVDAGVNDRFCLNVISRFGHQVDMTNFRTLNACFMAGADKGVAYELLNEYASNVNDPLFPRRVRCTRVRNRPEMVAAVLHWLREGRQAVIKAQGTGLGHGIEFFLNPQEELDEIIGKIDHSIRVTEHYYGAVGGAFPYTLCEFVNTATIARSSHPLHGHKYEVRIVVYRDGNHLRAMPSITKISSQGYDADRVTRLSLINNITTSAEAKKREGTDFMLPLCNAETLDLLGIRVEEMERLCVYCTGFVRHILDQVQASPVRFGLAGIWGELDETETVPTLKRSCPGAE